MKLAEDPSAPTSFSNSQLHLIYSFTENSLAENSYTKFRLQVSYNEEVSKNMLLTNQSMDRPMLTRLLFSLCFILVPCTCQAQLPNPDYYTLFQLTGSSSETRLIDSAGSVLHSWQSDISAVSGTAAYLREDGLLLRSGQRGAIPAGAFLPGSWSTVQLVESDGTVVWEYTQQVVGELTLHHDLKPMQNGNILVTVWEFFSAAEIQAQGLSLIHI